MPVPKAEVLELMRMNADPAELDEIRELWKEHSKAEDNRSIEGLLATLSEDCVYTVYPDDVSWHGHEGAARFYTELLTAFPDIVFELQNIVIGPQGVVEEAIVTGTHSGEVARQRADRRDDDLAERDLLPLGSGLAPLQGRARLHRHAEEGRMTYAFSSLDELGDGPGFRKVRGPLGVTAFGVNGVVYPPNYPGISHYHDTQDELYFVHNGTAKVHVEGEERILGPGGLFHVESTTPRRIESVGDEELVMLVIGGKDGYVERDGHVMSDEDLERRINLGKEQA